MRSQFVQRPILQTNPVENPAVPETNSSSSDATTGMGRLPRNYRATLITFSPADNPEACPKSKWNSESARRAKGDSTKDRDKAGLSARRVQGLTRIRASSKHPKAVTAFRDRNDCPNSPTPGRSPRPRRSLPIMSALLPHREEESLEAR